MKAENTKWKNEMIFCAYKIPISINCKFCELYFEIVGFSTLNITAVWIRYI